MEEYEKAIQHIEGSISHLKTMSDPVFGEIFLQYDNDSENEVNIKTEHITSFVF